MQSLHAKIQCSVFRLLISNLSNDKVLLPLSEKCETQVGNATNKMHYHRHERERSDPIYEKGKVLFGFIGLPRRAAVYGAT